MSRRTMKIKIEEYLHHKANDLKKADNKYRYEREENNPDYQPEQEGYKPDRR